MSGLIWIQTVWTSDGIFETFFFFFLGGGGGGGGEVNLKKKNSIDDKTSMQNYPESECKELNGRKSAKCIPSS